MRYKNQGDIDFQKFSDFSETIEDYNDSEIEIEVNEVFFKEYKATNIHELNKALAIPAKFKYKLDFDFKNVSRFIEADTYLTESDKLSLAKTVIRKRFFWQRIKYSLSDVLFAEQKFIEFVTPIKEQHEWIFNPPIIVSIKKTNENTEQAEYMKEFVNHYGSYMEIVYMICKGDFTKMDQIMDWSVDRFLFQGEYLLRKKRIESI